MKPLTIAYITETAASNKHAWSGTVHYIYKALLREGFNVVAIGPAVPSFTRILLATINKLSLLVFSKRFDYRHSVPYSRAFGRLFTKRINSIPHDLVVVCGGTEYGAYIKTSKPVYYILDRTIAGALNYHTILSNLWDFSERQSIYTDKKAMNAAEKVFFSSKWAAEHAMKYYNIPSEKIVVQPFGANLDSTPTREEALNPKNESECKLLLIGTYWHNKGADIAYNAMNILVKNKVDATLTVVGCTPPEEIHDERLTVIPFVDKNSATGTEQLWELFKSHHFFVLPTRFDCTPIVFCEASSFGLPILTANTGGVGGHVLEGINGFLLPYEDKGEGYAKKIASIIENSSGYRKLCETSRNYFEEWLNWNKWGNRFRSEITIRTP